MITQRHAHILDKPHSQIKLLKHDHADNLPIIKANHQGAWQDFKAFILSVYANLPTQFATPHIKNGATAGRFAITSLLILNTMPTLATHRSLLLF
ncbi:hypothetical protein G5C01_08950 [Moraxella bovoculi]|nr:HI_0552 family protein [Moraxella bovoculi]NSM11465.1 hypothetical protein [Moraxella bovoculi]